MNNCFHCQKSTKNPKYCSRTCAAKSNNKLFPKRIRKIFYCQDCNAEVKHRRKFCELCNPHMVDWSKLTYDEVSGIRKYQKSSRIRNLARSLYRKSNKPKKCIVCGYNKHYEVCHVKPIHSFPGNAFISEINNLNNLIALCPNCHWEFDKGQLFLDFSFLAAYT